jgi:nucleotide-binding universal stress UspA family protein
MSIRKILVPVDGTEAARATLAVALELARQFNAHLDVLHPRIDPAEAVAFAGEGMSGEVIQELMELTQTQAATRAAAAQAIFAEACSAAAITPSPPRAGQLTARLAMPVGRDEDAVADFGRLADLIVVGRSVGEREATALSVLNAALFLSGHPVLIVGEGVTAARFPRVLVAWNGSTEAARAVTAALPFLTAAASVTIAAAGDPAVGRAPEDVVEYLGCHGISCRIEALPRGRPVGEALTDAAYDADLVVMGAYTHGRLWQLILGGVTRHMLEHAPVPLLLAH